MRCARIKKERGVGVYHCISRAVAGAFLLDGEAKSVFRKMLWEVAEFCGVEVLTYCLMDNHFHILVRVPEGSPEVLTREEVLRRYGVLYEHSNTPGYPDAAYLRVIFAEEREALVQDWMERLTARMNDVSEFMKTLKQRFTMWFNKRHKRFGTLWSERFKSVLVQNDAAVVRTVAAYIDLNPVRAGLVEDPAAYAWSSYGEAMQGSRCAQNGLVSGLRLRDWTEAVESYGKTLNGKIGVRKQVGGRGSGLAVNGEMAKVEREASAEVSLRERQRVMTEGKVLGSEAFVEEVRGRKSPSEPDGSRSESRGLESPSKPARKPMTLVLPGGFVCFSWLRSGKK